MATSELRAIVAGVLKRQKLTGAGLVVAVSGGPDSVALLLALAELRETHQLRLHVAHFDHALRPDSASDAAWVVDLAAGLNVEVTTERPEAPSDSSHESSRSTRSEDASRRARYRFLANVARNVGAVAVLVGHTRDDQVETRLLHVSRGSGLRGLRGMSEDSLLAPDAAAPIRVVRPFLSVTRQATELFCAEHRIEPRLDSTNAEFEYARNRIRHRVVPQLTRINPRFADALDRLGRIAAETEDFIDSELDRQVEGLAEIADSSWTIDRARWLLLHRSLKRALLRRAANVLTPGREVGAEAIETAIVAADSWNAGRRLAWPDDRVLVVEHDHFEIRRSSPPRPLPQQVPLRPRVRSSVDLAVVDQGGWYLNLGGDWRQVGQSVLQLIPRSQVCVGRNGDRWHVDLDQATLGDATRFSLRSRRDGDWLAPVGMVGQKKLQDLFVDACVPESVRDRVPLVTTSGGVAWVIGVRRDRRFVAPPGCTDVLCLDVTDDVMEDRQ